MQSVDTIYCELRHTLTQPSYGAKETCYFVFERNENDTYKISGISVSGAVKLGEANLFENSGSEFYFKGSYIEGDSEIDFSFSFKLVSESVFFGSGSWEEEVAGKVRQKFRVVLKEKDASLNTPEIYHRLLSDREALEGKIAELNQKQQELKEKSDNTEASFNEIKMSLEKSAEQIARVNESERKLDDLRERNEALEGQLQVQLSEAGKAQEKLNIELGKIVETDNTLESLNQRIVETVSKAEAALGRAVTVGLASSFKRRKDESAKLKWIYDGIFVCCIVVAIIFAYDIFVNYLSKQNLDPQSAASAIIVRLPVVALFGWLGIFVSKKSATVSRLEEFYAQKQALAESYEGYRAEIEKISDEERGKEDLVKLMGINLLSISRDSSEVLDKTDKSDQHRSLANIFMDTLKSIVSRKPD